MKTTCAIMSKKLTHNTITTKQLIQKEGKVVFQDLLALHPDRSILHTLPSPNKAKASQETKAEQAMIEQ